VDRGLPQARGQAGGIPYCQQVRSPVSVEVLVRGWGGRVRDEVINGPPADRAVRRDSVGDELVVITGGDDCGARGASRGGDGLRRPAVERVPVGDWSADPGLSEREGDRGTGRVGAARGTDRRG
jgi:hypothetical protein